MTWPTTRWPTALELADRLREFAADQRFKDICTVSDLAEATSGGFRGNYVRVGKTGAPRPTMLFIGGVHAREWAPPTVLTNLVSALLEAYVGNTAITLGSTTRSAKDVKAIVDSVALYVAPLINPDGYDYSLTADATVPDDERKDRGWRKNRRPAPATLPPGCLASNPNSIGVDINRNFDVVWDFEKFYVAGSNVSASKDNCTDLYIGDLAFSEVESRNVRDLLQKAEPLFFVDVHMYGGTINYSWGTEENDPVAGATPLLNTGRVRDGTVPSSNAAFTGYKEPINRDVLNELERLGSMMADATQAASANRYQPQPSARLYPAPGASDDYSVARNLGTSKPQTRAFTIECGKTFLPKFTSELPSIQNEVQAALLALLRNAATVPASGPAASSKSCSSCSATS